MRLAVLGCLLFGLAGCATVAPYEREHVARIERRGESRQGVRGYDAHFWSVREAMSGGTGEPGGGCGCN